MAKTLLLFAIYFLRVTFSECKKGFQWVGYRTIVKIGQDKVDIDLCRRKDGDDGSSGPAYQIVYDGNPLTCNKPEDNTNIWKCGDLLIFAECGKGFQRNGYGIIIEDGMRSLDYKGIMSLNWKNTIDFCEKVEYSDDYGRTDYDHQIVHEGKEVICKKLQGMKYKCGDLNLFVRTCSFGNRAECYDTTEIGYRLLCKSRVREMVHLLVKEKKTFEVICEQPLDTDGTTTILCKETEEKQAQLTCQKAMIQRAITEGWLKLKNDDMKRKIDKEEL